MAPADYGEAVDEQGGVHLAAEAALEDHCAVVAEAGEPGGGGGGGRVWLEQEIVGGGADFLEIVYVGLFGEDRLAEAGERSAAGDGGSPGIFVEARCGSSAWDSEIAGAR